MDERKKRQKAVALHYQKDEHAPQVTAKGAGVIADKIIEKAEESDVAVYQDAKLVEELTRMDIGEHIPPELYEVVAQVLTFISELDEEAGKSLKHSIGLERLRPIGVEDV